MRAREIWPLKEYVINNFVEIFFLKVLTLNHVLVMMIVCRVCDKNC